MTTRVQHQLVIKDLDGKPVDVTVFLDIDDLSIARILGWKALRNKGQRSRMQIGITAEVRRR